MKENFDKIIANAEIASDVLDKLDGKLQNPEKLWTFFHLRPTTAGVTLVSTLGYAPMRGVVCSKEDLAEKIQAVDGKMGEFAGNAPDVAKELAALKDLGFKAVRGIGSAALQNVQAAFITEMNEREEAYGELRFIGSNLSIPKMEQTGGYHFDVVAYFDEAVYFIEIKNDRSQTAFTEMDHSMTDLYRNEEDYLKKLFAVYPLTAPGTEGLDLSAFHRVQGLLAMPEAENTTTDWQELASEHNIELWFYQTALIFRKYLPMNRTAIL